MAESNALPLVLLAEQFAKENGGSLTLANSTRMKGAWVRLRIAKESQK